MVRYKKGNLLHSGCNIICHQVNCRGVMGTGIAKEIRNKYPKVYERFQDRYKNGNARLGEIDAVCVFSSSFEDELYPIYVVVNFYSQYDYLPRGVNHTDYNAFRKCIKNLKSYIRKVTINGDMPVRIGFPDHIGCGLAGGDWGIVKNIIKEEFSSEQWEVEIWKLN